jgi:hypothetical protein
MTSSDVEWVLKELEAWREGQREGKLRWEQMERVSGCSRQTLLAKPVIAETFLATKFVLATRR